MFEFAAACLLVEHEVPVVAVAQLQQPHQHRVRGERAREAALRLAEALRVGRAVALDEEFAERAVARRLLEAIEVRRGGDRLDESGVGASRLDVVEVEPSQLARPDRLRGRQGRVGTSWDTVAAGRVGWAPPGRHRLGSPGRGIAPGGTGSSA